MIGRISRLKVIICGSGRHIACGLCQQGEFGHFPGIVETGAVHFFYAGQIVCGTFAVF